MIPEYILKRKGARSFKDLDKTVLEYLNKGNIQTANLIEWLAVDQLILLKNILTDLGKLDWYDSFYESISAQEKPSANSNTKVIGLTFLQLTNDPDIINYLSNHISDVPRCWAAYWLGSREIKIDKKLEVILPFAADSHFGVREVAIFSSKDTIIDNLDIAIGILSKWTSSKEENIRRFAVEVIRPIGVWTKKIDELKESPEKAITILDPLKSDDSKYVRDSVGNWLNDASKTRPDWVLKVCNKWKTQSQTKETGYIIKKALRTIHK
ncbi:DNA alkylation repair protein [Aquimarina muelleri]|uniref:DNA alkylation repair protein n=1 Tax=Aquimarina muelleri TaxID=279356 RepID=A0A918JRI8_9FLAO|nr:DNA alkylation repair protein [Aquimarina muelleri]MCX2763053.1 DNA alkylation repair protein [Aquimarina muelleri]GGX03145.1 DNA alkylation repair protein [Aquimarina muelleri]